MHGSMIPESYFVIRPFPSPIKDWKNVKIDINKKLIHLRSIEDFKRGKSESNIYWQFKADEIFSNVSQEEFYKATVTEELLQKIIKGFDLTILCFGSSGTGKTYSAFGTFKSHEYRGIAPRILEDLFRLKEDNAHLFKMDILLTYVEIIGKNIYNLLLKDKPLITKSGSQSYNASLAVSLENIRHGSKLIFTGYKCRNFENKNSHCGTSILTFEIISVSLIKSNPVNYSTKIHIIDTAGTDSGKKQIKSQKCHVNANLTKCNLNSLCFLAKSKYNPKKMSQRGSVMVLYLGSSIKKGYTRLLGHIKLSTEDLSCSMSTLLFGTRLRMLPSPLLVQAKTRNSDLLIKNLQGQLVELRDDMMEQKIIKGNFLPESISQNQMDYVMREISHFLRSEINSSCLLSIAHPSVLLIGLKKIYNRDMELLKKDYTKIVYEKIALSNLLEQERAKWMPSSSEKSYSRSHKKTISHLSASKTTPVTPTETQQVASPEQVNKVDLESETIGEDNYFRTFSEFLKSTQFTPKIKQYKTDIEQSFIEKCELQSKLTDLKYEINLFRMELLKEEWNSFNQTLELRSITDEGGVVKKSPKEESLAKEIDAKVEEFNLLRLSLLASHRKYMMAIFWHNETNAEAEKQYNEYVKCMFSNILLLPPRENTCNVNDKNSTLAEYEDRKNRRLQQRPLLSPRVKLLTTEKSELNKILK